MKQPDYSKIAATYDDLAVRRDVAPDATLGDWLRLRAPRGRPLHVLDVGCGTGNWLEAQAKAFADERVDFFGIDPSPAMLERARAKAPDAHLVVGRAEELPYDNEHFDYVVTRFTFHHIDDKLRALDELARVLRFGGVLHLVNVAPEHMPAWWVLRYFPEASVYSQARFWPGTLLKHEIAKRGFEVVMKIDRDAAPVLLRDMMEQVMKRDQSHLASLDDAAYEAGKARLQSDLEDDPGGSGPSELALVRITATRG